MENQLTQLTNRSSNPVSQLPCAQTQGSVTHERISLGLGYPHPFNSQPSLEDRIVSIRDISGRHSSSTNPNPLLGGTIGNQWNSARQASQDAEEGQTHLSGIPPAGQIAPRCDSKSQSCPPDFLAQFNPWVPGLNQEASSSVELSPQGELRPFFRSDNQNKSEISQQNSPAEDKKSGNLLDCIQPWDIETTIANASNDHITAGSSIVRQSLEERRTKRWRRKVTERRREQNRVHQRAFRQRRKLMLKQKDMAISNLKERLVQCQVAVGQQSEIIRILQARLSLVKTFRLSTAT